MDLELITKSRQTAFAAGIQRDLEEGRLVRVLDGSLQGPANFYLVWQRYRKSPAIAALVTWLIAEVGTTASKD